LYIWKYFGLNIGADSACPQTALLSHGYGAHQFFMLPLTSTQSLQTAAIHDTSLWISQ